MTDRWLNPPALVSALVTGTLGMSLPWLLPPAPPVRVLVGAIVAAQGYAAVALVHAVFRWAGRPPARPAHRGRPRYRHRRRLAVGTVLGVLVLACPPGGVAGAGGYRPSAAPAAPAAPAWDTLGTEGRVFERTTPDRAAIERLTGRPGTTPVRVYVGVRSAPTDRARARLAVAELDRAGAFSRPTILAVMPTGSGWVDPAAVRALELLTGGDLATVAVQYAERPSWLEYLAGAGRAERSARALTTALRRRIDAVPAARRPRLLVYGESLGAVAAASSVPGADRTLLVGRPGGAGSEPADPRVTALVHTDDPVGWWSPALAVRRPAGWPGVWLPLISFWQVSGALPGAVGAPAGHGHHYGAELVDAWAAADPGGAAGAAPPRLLRATRSAIEHP